MVALLQVRAAHLHCEPGGTAIGIAPASRAFAATAPHMLAFVGECRQSSTAAYD